MQERALWLWARDLHKAMGNMPLGTIERVLEYAYGFGTLIPERFLIDAFRSFNQDPPDRKVCRNVLEAMGVLPKV